MLLGRGALANYHDLAPADRADFEHWHTTQHLPERVAVAGFLRGRRYLASAPGTSPDYFILYETADVSVLQSAAYVARLDAPTPWTTRVSARMTRTLRTASRVHASAGRGIGGHLFAVRLHPQARDEQTLLDTLNQAAMTAIAACPGICGAHALCADAAVTAVDTAERALREPPDEIVPWILLLEGESDAATGEAWEILRAKLPMTTDSLTGRYALQTLFTLCDL